MKNEYSQRLSHIANKEAEIKKFINDFYVICPYKYELIRLGQCNYKCNKCLLKKESKINISAIKILEDFNE